MSVDGAAEWAAIVARAKTLADGRFVRGVPDAKAHLRFGAGEIRPFLAGLASTPLPVKGGSTFADRESDVPHRVVVSIASYAGDQEVADSIDVDVRNLFRDWQPSPTCAPMSVLNGYTANDARGDSTPSRFEAGTSFLLVINLGPDA